MATTPPRETLRLLAGALHLVGPDLARFEAIFPGSALSESVSISILMKRTVRATARRMTYRMCRVSEPASTRLEKDMNSPLSVFDNGKLASRASRWRLAAAMGAVTVIGASAAVTSPASAAVISPAVSSACAQYHDWYVCIGYSDGVTTVDASNDGNAGTHTMFLEVNGGGTYSTQCDFTADTACFLEVNVTPNPSAKSWGGIDSTRIVGADI